MKKIFLLIAMISCLSAQTLESKIEDWFNKEYRFLNLYLVSMADSMYNEENVVKLEVMTKEYKIVSGHIRMG